MTKFKELFEAKLTDLAVDAKAVWAEQDLEKKRELLFKLINNMKGSPAKVKYTTQAQGFKKAEAMDKLASNLMLAPENKMIK